MRADQARSRGDQVRVVSCRPAIGEERDVFQPRTDTMPFFEPASIHIPTRWAISVVNLLQRDACGRDDVLHLRSVVQRGVYICVERLDEDAPTSTSQSGADERS